MKTALREHWPEYLMEAAGLGFFMISAGLFTILLEHPGSFVQMMIDNALLRRVLMGAAMGVTAIAIIYSPWGQRSGAHINPAVTLTFYRLGKIKRWDAVFYMLSQFGGGLLGLLLVAVNAGKWLVVPSVNYVVTVPGVEGAGWAFIAELLISFGLMLAVLIFTNRMHLARFTGIAAGILVAVYIALEAPFSGMSMNPARSLASALPAHVWTAFWVYITAPIMGMLAAAEIYQRTGRARGVICAKLNHHNDKRCIFNCGYMKAERQTAG